MPVARRRAPAADGLRGAGVGPVPAGRADPPRDGRARERAHAALPARRGAGRRAGAARRRSALHARDARTSVATGRCSRTRRTAATDATSTSSRARCRTGRSGASSRADGAGSGASRRTAAGSPSAGSPTAPATTTCTCGRSDTGEAVHASPHDEEAEYFEPVWLRDSSGFLTATNEDRDTFAIRRYEIESRSWETVVESRWDLECAGDDAGRSLLVLANEDGYSRLELRDPRTLELREEVPLPGRGVVAQPVFSKDGSLLAFGFARPTEPYDVYLYDLDAHALTRLTVSPRDVDPATLVEPELHRFASFDGESIPVFLYEPEGEGPFPVVVSVHGGPESQARPEFAPLTQHLVVTRLRGRGAERARLDRVRQALRASRRRREAAGLGPRPRGAARVARRPAGDRRLAGGAVRPLVRRLHGARRPRVPTRAVGRRNRDVSASRASSRSSRTRRTTAAPRASASTGRSTATATSSSRRRR